MREILLELFTEFRSTVEATASRLPTNATTIDALGDHHLSKVWINLTDFLFDSSEYYARTFRSLRAETKLCHVNEGLSVDTYPKIDWCFAVRIVFEPIELVANLRPLLMLNRSVNAAFVEMAEKFFKLRFDCIYLGW